MNTRSHEQIKRLLPHRYPMLLVDSVADLQPGRSIRAVKTITLNEACYHRLQPAGDGTIAAAYPPSLLIESFCQAAGILLLESRSFSYDPSTDVMLFGSLSHCLFERDALPGDTVEHHAVIHKAFTDAAICGGEIRVRGERIATIEQVVVALRALRQPEEANCEA